MSMLAIKDLYTVQVSLAQGALKTSTSNSGTNAGSVDLANAIENMVVINTGALTDGTHTPKLQESVDGSSGSFSDVAAADQVGTLTALAANTTQKVSYIGKCRYIRVVVTVTGTPSTGAYYAAYVITRQRKLP